MFSIVNCAIRTDLVSFSFCVGLGFGNIYRENVYLPLMSACLFAGVSSWFIPSAIKEIILNKLQKNAGRIRLKNVFCFILPSGRANNYVLFNSLTKTFLSSSEKAAFQMEGESTLQFSTALCLVHRKFNFSWSWFLYI